MRLRTGPDTKITCDLVIRCGNAVSMMEVAPGHALLLLQQSFIIWHALAKYDSAWERVGGEATYDKVAQAAQELSSQSEDLSHTHWAGVYFDVTDKQYNAQFHLDDGQVAFDAYAEVQTTYLARKLSRTLKVLGISLDKALQKDGQLVE